MKKIKNVRVASEEVQDSDLKLAIRLQTKKIANLITEKDKLECDNIALNKKITELNEKIEELKKQLNFKDKVHSDVVSNYITDNNILKTQIDLLTKENEKLSEENTRYRDLLFAHQISFGEPNKYLKYEITC